MGPIVLMHTHPLPTKHNNNAKSNKTRKHFKLFLGCFHLNILPHAPQTHYVQDRTQCLLPGACSSLSTVTNIFFYKLVDLQCHVSSIVIVWEQHSCVYLRWMQVGTGNPWIVCKGLNIYKCFFAFFLCCSDGKESACIAGVRSLGQEVPLRREWQPTPVFLPGEFHGLYSPWDRKEMDKSERLSLLSSQCFVSSFDLQFSLTCHEFINVPILELRKLSLASEVSPQGRHGETVSVLVEGNFRVSKMGLWRCERKVLQKKKNKNIGSTVNSFL